MIFKHAIEQVLDGSKTQTRRVIKDGQTAVYENGWTRHVSRVLHGDPGSRVKYEVGRTYAVQPGRGKKGVARIRITDIWRERVQDITNNDALAEGCEGNYAPTIGFFNYRDHPLVTASYYGESPRLHFKQVWDSIQPTGRRWEDNPEVWVIGFELVEEVE